MATRIVSITLRATAFYLLAIASLVIAYAVAERATGYVDPGTALERDYPSDYPGTTAVFNALLFGVSYTISWTTVAAYDLVRAVRGG